MKSEQDGLWTAFHGHPIGVVQSDDTLITPFGCWILGVCLGALGRYGDAATILCPGGEPAGSLAASARASHLRQLGRHAEAEPLDRHAESLADAAPDPLAARADALIGLAADAVGLNRRGEVRDRLTDADRFVTRMADTTGWRARIRLQWVHAEAALLLDDPDRATHHAGAALREARVARAPRHETKSLLVLGVAQAAISPDTALTSLDRSARRASALGLLPLVWPARLVRSRVLERVSVGTSEAARDHAEAVHALHAIAANLHADEAQMFLSWLK